MNRVEFVNTNYKEVEAFVLSLSDKERRYYPIRWGDLEVEAIFVKGYRYDGELIGITGVSRKYFIAYSAFYMVKESYWGKGIGTSMSLDIIQWAKKRHIPCIIIQYLPQNMGIVRVLEKSGMPKGIEMGVTNCSIVPMGRWALPVKYSMFALAWCYFKIKGWQGND